MTDRPELKYEMTKQVSKDCQEFTLNRDLNAEAEAQDIEPPPKRGRRGRRR